MIVSGKKKQKEKPEKRKKNKKGLLACPRDGACQG
jgi:hypothetical protein